MSETPVSRLAPATPATSARVRPNWERRLQQIALVIGRIGLAYLFFTQLWWKLPPTFSCPPDFAFTTGTPENLQRTSGLCEWIGIEEVWSTQPRSLLQANLDNQGGPELSVPVGWAAQLNGEFIRNVVQPNIRWFGWIIWGSEAFIVVSLFLGLFSRLGALVAIGIATQLMIGLAGISNPFEWEWSYNTIVLLSIILFALAPGRYFGIDALLRPRLMAAAARGNRLAQIGLVLT